MNNEMINGKSLKEIIKTLLFGRDSSDRIFAAHLLGRDGNPKVVDGLIKGYKQEKDQEVKGEIIVSLGLTRAKKAMAKLLNILNFEPDLRLKKKAIWSLSKNQPRNEIIEPIENLLLTDNHSDIRQESASALGRLKSQQSLGTLEDALTLEPSPSVKKQIVWSLTQIEHPKVVQILVKVLPQELNPEVRSEIIWALSDLGTPSAAEELTRHLKLEHDPKIIQLTVWAIGRIDSPLEVDTFHQILDDETFPKEIHSEIIWLLGRKRHTQSSQKLTKFLSGDDQDLKRLAIWALGQMSGEEILDVLEKAREAEKNAEIQRELDWIINEIKNR